jgi:hypothetical protein
MTGGAQTSANRAVTPGNAGRKGGALGAPFYARPLEYLRGNITGIADGLRSLPDHQLEHELGELRAVSQEPAFFPAEQLMFWLYRAEAARRTDPELQFDVALDLALGRVERQTNDADRAFIADVGRKLEAIGGRAAMVRAYDRMMALARPKMVERRRHILSKRWAGIAP